MSMLAALLHQTMLPPRPCPKGRVHILSGDDEDDNNGEKCCSACLEILPLDRFYLRGDGRYSSQCKHCTKAKYRKNTGAVPPPIRKTSPSYAEALTHEWIDVRALAAKTGFTRAAVIKAMRKPEVIAISEKMVTRTNGLEKYLWRLK